MDDISFYPVTNKRARHQPVTRSSLRCSAFLKLKLRTWTKGLGEIDLNQIFSSHRLGIGALSENIRHNVVPQGALDTDHRGSAVVSRKNSTSLCAGSRP